MTCGLYACTEQVVPEYSEKEVVQKNGFEYTLLKTELFEYTSKFDLDPYRETRRGGFWRRLLGVFGADGAGAAIGSLFGGVGTLVGGIGNSILFAAMGDEFMNTEMHSCEEERHIRLVVIPKDSLTLRPFNYASFPMARVSSPLKAYSPDLDKESPIPPIYEQITSDGYVRVINFEGNNFGSMHNSIISEMYEEDENILSRPHSYVVDKMIECVEEKGFHVSEDITQGIMDQLNKDMESCEDLESTIAVFKTHYPDFSNVLDIIQDFVQNASSCSSESQLDEYVRGYLSIVAESDLSQQDKEVLSSAIEVSANSILLWCVQ